MLLKKSDGDLSTPFHQQNLCKRIADAASEKAKCSENSRHVELSAQKKRVCRIMAAGAEDYLSTLASRTTRKKNCSEPEELLLKVIVVFKCVSFQSCHQLTKCVPASVVKNRPTGHLDPPFIAYQILRNP